MSSRTSQWRRINEQLLLNCLDTEILVIQRENVTQTCEDQEGDITCLSNSETSPVVLSIPPCSI